MRHMPRNSGSHRSVICEITVGRNDVITRRLSGLLARRGYGYDIVRTVLKTLRDNGETSGDIALEISDD